MSLISCVPKNQSLIFSHTETKRGTRDRLSRRFISQATRLPPSAFVERFSSPHRGTGGATVDIEQFEMYDDIIFDKNSKYQVRHRIFRAGRFL